jgi:hypothetical protein
VDVRKIAASDVRAVYKLLGKELLMGFAFWYGTQSAHLCVELCGGVLAVPAFGMP